MSSIQMKSFLLSALMGAAASSSLALAADEHHPEGAAVQAIESQPASRPQTGEPSMARFQGQMTKMQDQMHRMQVTTDPAARRDLMNEHMQSMQEGMETMRGNGGPMAGGGMMGGPMAGGGMMGRPSTDGAPNSGAMGGGMMQRRMAMMQAMMEQMQEHQKWMRDTPK
jgi:hypothetical protein